MTLDPESACRHSLEKLDDYLDESLDVRARAAVTAHLRGCEACRGELALHRRALALTRRAMLRDGGRRDSDEDAAESERMIEGVTAALRAAAPRDGRGIDARVSEEDEQSGKNEL